MNSGWPGSAGDGRLDRCKLRRDYAKRSRVWYHGYMETCDAFDPIFEAQCTLPASSETHRHCNDEDGLKVFWDDESTDSYPQVTVG